MHDISGNVVQIRQFHISALFQFVIVDYLNEILGQHVELGARQKNISLNLIEGVLDGEDVGYCVVIEPS